MDLKSKIIQGSKISVLQFAVPRRKRREVREEVRNHTFTHVQEVRSFKGSTFTLTYIGNDTDGNLKSIHDKFESITI